VGVRSEVDHGMNLFWAVPQQPLQVADKPVDITLSRGFQYDIFVVVISETPRELFVVHLWLVLPDAPPPCHLVRVGHLELPPVPGPDDEVLAGLVCEQFEEELPELNGTGASEAGTSGGLGKHGSLHQGSALRSWRV